MTWTRLQLWPSLAAGGIIALTVAIFVIDFRSPLGLAFWVLYLFPLWLASRLYRHYPSMLEIVCGLSIALIISGMFIAPEGAPFWMSLANRGLWVAVIWTVTVLMLRSVRREQAIQEREERLTLALQGAQLGTWEINLVTGRLSLSRRMREMTGLPTGIPLHQLEDWRDHIHPDDVPRVKKQFAEAVQLRDSFESQFRVVHGTRAVRWLFSKGKIVRDATGRPIRAVGVAMDMTERQQAEEERLRLLQEAERREQELRDKQMQLVQSAKLASLGELTTGIAHELNNPLNNINLILGNLIDQVQERSLEHNALLFRLNLAVAEVTKAATIIQHLRTFGRQAPAKREPIHVNALLEAALALMQEQLRLRNIELTLDLSESDPVVSGNRIQLEQVFINLLTNARDAVVDTPKKAIVLTTDVKEHRVDIMFRDSGVGIPPESHSRIFDPFFTTKPVGEGTGLGLSVSYGIIKDHHGHISLTSRPGEGTTFVVSLPLIETQAHPPSTVHLFFHANP